MGVFECVFDDHGAEEPSMLRNPSPYLLHDILILDFAAFQLLLHLSLLSHIPLGSRHLETY